ncbi:MAG: FHA domain-containing protein [Alphaproteobacteria bacterium]|nr:FHA domain-containing protein [Alphaproteobacteria bacterium]
MKYTDLKARFETPKNAYERMSRGFNPRLVAKFKNGFPRISCNGHAEVETGQFKQQCEALQKGEIFVIGRAGDCNYYLPKSLLIDENGHRANKTSVSRYHCFIKKTDDGTFELYDVSATYTMVCLD